MLVRSLIDEIYGGASAVFEADGDPQQAAETLMARTLSPSSVPFLSDCVVGTVTVDRVILYRHRRIVPVAFAPVFVGVFAVVAGHTQLQGRFELAKGERVFVSLWLLGLAISCVAIAVAGARNAFASGGSVWAVILAVSVVFLVGAVMMFAMYIVLTVSKARAQPDVAMIESHIRECLRSH